MTSKNMNLSKGVTCGHGVINLKIWILVILLVLGAISGILPLKNTNAAPVVIDEDSYGSWEDNFEDTTGIETWDNLELTEEGIRLIDYLYENFTGLNGDLPNTKKWHILDDGYVLEISNNVLRTEVSPPPSTWRTEMIQTKDDFSRNHTLIWRQNLYTVSSGMYYHFFILNGSDGSWIFGVNQLHTGQYQIYNAEAATGLQIGSSVSGWHDFKVTFDSGFIQFFFDGVKKYEYNFNVTSVKYQFGTHALDTWNRVHTEDIRIYSNITTGNISSTEIILSDGKTWESLVIDKSECGIDNNIYVSILDGVTYLPIPGFENFGDINIDISAIDEGTYPIIRLRAYFSGNGSTSPILHGWKVTWIDTIPPSIPTGLTVIDPFTGNSLFLSWNANVESDVTTYILYYSIDDTTFYLLANVPVGILSFTHFGLVTGTTYYYKIAAADEVPNQSPFSGTISGIPDIDIDGDGIGNIVDDDDDGDTVPDSEDDFPFSENEWIDFDGDGIGDNIDVDDDNDGYYDTIDDFPYNSTEWSDIDFDSIGDNIDNDIDGDGYDNTIDDFESNPNEWLDTDNDGIGNNADMDDDNDGYYDTFDDFPFNSSEWSDLDFDGIGDNTDNDIDADGYYNTVDNFPFNPNEWLDTDDDGIGNNADMDDDNDGYYDTIDDFPLNASEYRDLDDDRIGDNSDDDIDGDGISNDDDKFPTNAQEWDDFDEDGIGDNLDPDDDNDGHLDMNDDYPYNPSKWQKPNELLPFLYIMLVLFVVLIVIGVILVAKIGKLQKSATLKIPEQRLPQPPKDEEIMPPSQKELEFEKSDEEKSPLETERVEQDLPPPPPISE